MAWLPEGENIFEDMFISFDGIHVRDRRTDTARRHRTRLYTVSCGKNSLHVLQSFLSDRVHLQYIQHRQGLVCFGKGKKARQGVEGRILGAIAWCMHCMSCSNSAIATTDANVSRLCY